MRRKALGFRIAIALGLVLALVILIVSQLAQRRPGAVQPPQSKAPGLAPQANIPSHSKATGFFSRESEAERRKRMMSGKDDRGDFKLTPDEIGLYVQASRSNAMSLAAAFESTRDKNYLKLAAEKYPNDAFIQSKILLHDVFPEDRAKWIDAFKKSAPDNALGNLLAARDAIKSGNVDAAKAEIAGMRDKHYDEYMRQSMQGLEEAYLSAGRPLTEAVTLGFSEITLPHLAQIKETAREFCNMADQAGASGDTKTQQELLAYAYAIGDKMRNAPNNAALITELVGVAVQNLTLGKWPQDVPFGNQTAADVAAQNKEYRDGIRKAAPIFDAWFPTAPDNEIIAYGDRLKMFGEREASTWLREIHPELAQAPPQN